MGPNVSKLSNMFPEVEEILSTLCLEEIRSHSKEPHLLFHEYPVYMYYVVKPILGYVWLILEVIKSLHSALSNDSLAHI